MQILRRTLGVLGFRVTSQEEPKEHTSDYAILMRDALKRVRLAELQIQEATTLEELDVGRSEMLAGWAEVQQLVRQAKRERGIAVRPISETEELHRQLRDVLAHRDASGVLRRKTGTGR
jgi:hypothetical protein